MATNHFDRQGIPEQTVYNQQFFVVCGPIAETNSPSVMLRKLWREHSLSVSVVVIFGLFLLGSWWGAMDYPGANELLAWRCELLAGILSLLTISLFRTFRRWGQERAERVISQRKSQREPSEMVNLLLCTPPPLSDEMPIPAQPEFSVTIEQWKSHAPTPMNEASIHIQQLPDEFIAPDALVLNFEMKRAA
jgi:hypothetical protein